MAINMYDSANALEKAIRESSEYVYLKQMYDEVNSDTAAKVMFDQFRHIQLNLQQKQMSGQPITNEDFQQAQASVMQVQQNEKISRLMEAEQRMSMIIQEINQVVMKPLSDLYGSL
ncbi:YlbF family regulator [Bacillus rubiinfantis]|uniref:YlbF family regulator n=1 Tax=Bacillus rubiinfantis TaxID=1499680 RepID=UPI0005AA84DF|nr:YlbF family regulator [Bacillus rubiinfantis]